MVNQEIARIVTDLGAALNRHDAGAAAALYAMDAAYREPGTGIDVCGRVAVEAVTAEVLRAFPDARFGLGGVVADRADGTAVVEWWAQGTHLGPFRGFGPTGRCLRLEAASVLTLRGGLIAEETVYLDPAPLVAAVTAGGAREQPELLTRGYFAAWAAADTEAVLACFHPRGSRQVAGGPRYTGAAGLRHSIGEGLAALRDWHLQVRRVRAGAGCCAAELALLPRHPRQEGAREVLGVSVLTWADHQLQVETLYLDTMRLGRHTKVTVREGGIMCSTPRRRPAPPTAGWPSTSSP